MPVQDSSTAARLSSTQGIEHTSHHPRQSSFNAISPTAVIDLGNLRSIRELLNSKKELICGSGASLISMCITFPINKMIFRQQLLGISGLHAVGQLKKDGLQFLYRGSLPPLFQKSISLAIMFGAYKRFQDVISDFAPFLSTTQNHILAALMAGTVEASLTPFERIQVLMQSRNFHQKFSNTSDAIRGLRRFGYAEYYRGLSIIIMRNGPSTAFFFLGKEFLESKVLTTQSESGKMAMDFTCGACLGALISTLFFPFNVVKTHMQYQLGGPFTGVWHTFRLVLTERDGKFWKLYRGMHLNFTRSFLSWGIINASYEFLVNNLFSGHIS